MSPLEVELEYVTQGPNLLDAAQNYTKAESQSTAPVQMAALPEHGTVFTL
jgi:hypothetical protein